MFQRHIHFRARARQELGRRPSPSVQYRKLERGVRVWDKPLWYSGSCRKLDMLRWTHGRDGDEVSLGR